LIDIHEIYKFYAPMGLRKYFKFGLIRCIIEEVIGSKPQYNNFHQNFRGLWRTNCGSDPKNRGAKMWRTSFMRMQSLVGIGERTAAENEKNNGSNGSDLEWPWRSFTGCRPFQMLSV